MKKKEMKKNETKPKKMKNIIMIRSNPVSPDPRIEKEAVILGEAGHNVTILAWDRDGKNKETENKKYYSINRFKFNAPYGKPQLFLKLFIWWIYEFIYLLRNGFDVVHACDFDTLIVSVLVAKIKNKIVVYDCFDFYADCLPIKVPLIIRKLVAKLEIYFQSFANFVIIVDESRLAQFKNKIKKFVIIYNSPSEDTDDIEEKKEDINNTNNGEDDIIIFYAGILDETRGFRQLINASDNIPNIKIIIAGFGSDEKSLSKLFYKSKNVNYLGKIQYKDVIKYTNKSDLLFALYDPKIPNNRYASPNKLFEAMMCGKPIIVSDGTSMADIVREEKCGIVVPYGDIKMIRKKIIGLINDRQYCRELGNNGRKAYESRYSYKIMKKRLLDSYYTL